MKKPECPVCNKAAIKYGTRKTKLQQIQVYLCKSCSNRFSITTQQNKTYPISIILKAISTYNLGYTQKGVSGIIQSKHKIKLPLSTISSWINEHKETCTFSRLRKLAMKLYNPKNIIHKQNLHHIQPYTFNKDFPHHIFTYNKNINLINSATAIASNNLSNENRASQIKFNHLNINNIKKQNQANQLAKLALNLAKTNKERHQALQDFFLINDSTTIAVEVPIYLTNWDAGYYRNQKGFNVHGLMKIIIMSFFLCMLFIS